MSYSRLGMLLILFVLILPWMLSNPASSDPSESTTPGFIEIAAIPGSADDTERIQQAIDRGVGSIRFSKGTYRISKPIEIHLNRVGFTSLHGEGVARIVMTGPGPAVRWIGTHGGTAAPKTVKEEVWDRQRTPLMDALEIVGQHAEADGVEAHGTMQLTLSRMTIRKCRHAVHLIDRNRNVTLSECHIYENQGVGVFLDHLNLHQINIANCHISYNAGGGIVSRHSEIRNLQIGTCDIEGNMGDENAPPSANIEIDGSESSIGEVTIVGCTIQHSHVANDSANIRINGIGTLQKFTDELRHGHITIADNILSDVQTNIELINSRGVTITGNTIWKGYNRDLHMENCKDIVLANNAFDRNPRYHYGDGTEAKQGILIQSCQDCSLNGNLITGTQHKTAAVHLIECDRFNITNCSILEYGQCGLQLENVSRSRISDCLIDQQEQSEVTPSIRILNSNKNMLRDNLLGGSIEDPQNSSNAAGNEFLIMN
ncbi:right-handed parallel beta-helix repeat-containing protein [Rubinisphaera italica]|uniref:Pectate lyase superfamily protein n=1 Tax=Rubinisphaera italica TaxID=2527969 RepID=A0A5C5XHY1_9PLAN|nr:right-handed parallel beta-helix repeat-containing protein [Rubinisphaera italica]TWT62308.1 Pectate lyase superfamily protein [Rubinisphaera italica]